MDSETGGGLPAMAGLVDSLGAAWLDGGLGAAILLGAAALAMVGCAQPSRRCWLARGAVLGALALLPLAWLAPLPRLPVCLPLRELVAPQASSWTQPGPLACFDRRVRLGLTSAASAVGLGLVALGWLGGWRLIRKTVGPAPGTSAVYQALPYRSPLPRPRLRVSARVRAPVLIGVVRATILIPPDLDEPGAAGALRLVLLHELAHAERLDPVFGLASDLAGALWFFVPPLWWVRGQMRLDQEFLADLHAADHFGPPVAYASSLVDLAQAAPVIDEGEANTRLGGSALLPRVLMLVRCPFPVEARAPRRWRWACASGLAGLTLLASGLSLRGVAARPIFEGPPPGAESPRHGVLQIARLTIPAPDPGPDGLCPPYTLLRTLPLRFEMVLDVWADPADLPKIAIAGRWLGPPLSRPGEAPWIERFHRVRLVRDSRGIALWVGGRPVPPRVDTPPPSPWLSLRPAPGVLGRYRNLILSW